MDWDCYKHRCDSPQVFSRWMLTQTLELLEATTPSGQSQADLREVQERLEAALAGPPLPKPDDHRGGAVTDMFELELAAAQAQLVLSVVRDAVRSGAVTAATRSRGLGGFVEAWTEYIDRLAGRAAGTD